MARTNSTYFIGKDCQEVILCAQTDLVFRFRGIFLTVEGVPEISIIVPVYNEAANVIPMAQEVAAAFEPTPYEYELVFVDDGSTDDTWKEILAAQGQFPRIRGLRHLRNSGQSAAVWTGIQHSTTNILATLDGDLQNDPADLPGMITWLREVDFVSGKRVKRRDTFVRRTSSRIARWARKTALGVDVMDTGCAIRVFKRSAMEGVFPFNGLHRFLPVLVQGAGKKTLEIGVNHRPRVAGVSKYGVWNRLWRGIYDLFAIRWYLKRRILPTPVEESVAPAQERAMSASR